MHDTPNVDSSTIHGFGLQWRDFDQFHAPSSELETIFHKYFDHFPWGRIDQNSIGLDAGCGSGRWAMLVAPRVKKLICVDASSGAAAVAQERLRPFENCEVHVCTLEETPVSDSSLDFAYCLGVLHYVPDPRPALAAIAQKLKPGAPLLLYVYYALENRPVWFRAVWRVVDLTRRGIARTAYPVRRCLSDILAALVYLPMARLCNVLERVGVRVGGIPLSAYRHRSFYTMRTDCLDRFGNHLEHRFTRQELFELLRDCGLTNIVIPEDEPYWRAVAVRTGL
jgi:ubiquinone/menaquinone biosynthesis C-methylase UbiE